ncbi:CHAT domain-containing protein [Solirubrobacter phytolaccae]|uniref:CHAT domain-containing protein n=1 Tax=Solirubrobacter phytolaccae TaxID=1404360 RepID=A0A9X3SC77_9ACTN|nr:CHAT domain-containing protein [Solirubrobacter phytolaccae]MDA0182195.1 CHAT domain-containing protein [Solirubrobacter phytolaccae]
MPLPHRPRTPNGRPQLRLTPRTALIRITGTAERGWVVGFHDDDGRGDWTTSPIAEARLDAPLPPFLTSLDAHAAIRRCLLDEHGHEVGLEAVGEYLHGLLHQGAIGEAWDAAAMSARPSGLRLLLDLPDSLASLPWELLIRGLKRPATDVAAPLVRVGRSFCGASTPEAVRWPLKVLMVVGSAADDERVAAFDEVRNVQHALRRHCGQTDVEVLWRPTRAELRERYDELRPHIFHFIGHGDVEDGRGRLLLHDPRTGDQHPWTAPEIHADLAAHPPRLAILNACRSADRDEDRAGAWRVADAFVELEVAAVIAMQADIRGDVAAAFTAELYTALVQHEPLDVAVSRARRAITDTTGFERRDFAVPSLTVNAPPESVLRLRYGTGDEDLDPGEPLQRQYAGFVDRTRERRRLWRVLDPEPELEIAPGVIEITGPAAVGKSELARWCVTACEVHGGNAAYVDLKRGGRVDCLATLGLIAAELAAKPQHQDANAAAFAAWREAVETLTRTPAAPPNALETTFALFTDALREAAGDRPLLVTLDHVAALATEELELLCDYLLEPAAHGQLEPVRFIVAVSEEQAGALTERLRRAIGASISLRTFRPDEFGEIALQYFFHHFDVPRTDVEATLAALPSLNEDFSWGAVVGLASYIEGIGWERYK